MLLSLCCLPLDAIIFIENVGDLGYISFAIDLQDFIFNFSWLSLTGSVALSMLSIRVLNFSFIFKFVDFLITFLH